MSSSGAPTAIALTLGPAPSRSPRLATAEPSSSSFTIVALKFALCWIPLTRIAVMIATMITAGRSMKLLVRTNDPVAASNAIGARAIACGTWRPSFGSSVWKKLDQPFATVAEPTAYSRMRSHPMIQATSSPSVAYEYAYALPAWGIIAASSA